MKNTCARILLLLSVVIFLASCQSQKTTVKPEYFGDGTYYDPSLRFIEDNQRDGQLYSGERGKIDVVEKFSKYIKFEKDQTKLQNADAVEYINDIIYVVDSISHEIAVFDLEGNRLKTIGKEGKAEAEFKSPVDIFYHAGHAEYYILDAGNDRVQVFDLKDKFIREISLKAMGLKRTNNYQSISVDDDKNIYIAPLTAALVRQRLCRVNEEGEVYWYPHVVYGATILANNKIYFFDNYEIFVSKNPDAQTVEITDAGINNIYEVRGDNKEKVFSLPHSYSPSSIVIDGDKMYIFSSFYSTIDLFKIDGNNLVYQHSLTEQMNSPNTVSSFSYDLAFTGSHLILAHKEDANIYLFDLDQEE